MCFWVSYPSIHESVAASLRALLSRFEVMCNLRLSLQVNNESINKHLSAFSRVAVSWFHGCDLLFMDSCGLCAWALSVGESGCSVGSAGCHAAPSM